MVNIMLIPIRQQGDAPDSAAVYQLSAVDVVPVQAVRLRRAPLTFADMRRCLMQDFMDGAEGSHPVQAARAALARVDILDLWPHTAAGWLAPFGQFLLDLAPLLDDPQIVLGRYGHDR